MCVSHERRLVDNVHIFFRSAFGIVRLYCPEYLSEKLSSSALDNIAKQCAKNTKVWNEAFIVSWAGFELTSTDSHYSSLADLIRRYGSQHVRGIELFISRVGLVYRFLLANIPQSALRFAIAATMGNKLFLRELRRFTIDHRARICAILSVAYQNYRSCVGRRFFFSFFLFSTRFVTWRSDRDYVKPFLSRRWSISRSCRHLLKCSTAAEVRMHLSSLTHITWHLVCTWRPSSVTFPSGA